MSTDKPTVLILGAGVHGAAIARELVLNGVGVHLVDKFDIAFGATSKSSRSIHGGLRYLEYGDFRLVRESLEARSLNLWLAPHFVHPLRINIPISQSWSGLFRSALGFFGLSRTAWGRRWSNAKSQRGYWPVRIGLMMYDWYGSALARSSALPVGTPGTPRVNPNRYRWLCSYSDAQMLYPERFVLALLADVRQVAQERGVPFSVSTYTDVDFQNDQWLLRDRLTQTAAACPGVECVINATGAWGDGTLAQLRIDVPPLFGGTKGTHFLTWNGGLREALQGQAVYAEADDGRLVFVLPFGEGLLVGTTDETFAARPETAAATEEELDYLLHLVNDVMDCRLTRRDIVMHYSGVRPLPRSNVGENAAISRDHAVVEHRAGRCPVLTLVGGKLTTWREFSVDAADRALRHLGRRRTADLRLRPIPGRPDFSEAEIDTDSPILPVSLWKFDLKQVADEFKVAESLVAALWQLYGTRTREILDACRTDPGRPVEGTPFTTGVVRWILEHEWVRTLSDLIERRLMLVFAKDLSRKTVADLAECLVSADKLSAEDVPREIAATIERLTTFYGRRFDT